MRKKRKKTVTIVKRSCITGKIIWVYRGASSNGAHVAYWRACKKEVRRVRQRKAIMNERRRRLMKLLAISDSSSTDSSIFGACRTPEQVKAIKSIIQMWKQEPSQDRNFYDHLIEEARRRNWFSERWRGNREKMIRYGQSFANGERKPTKSRVDAKFTGNLL